MNAALNDAIFGTGTFPVDTSVATDGATPASTCPTCHKDVWFEYTATTTGVVTVAACGSTTVDTVLAVWDGAGCPTGTSFACNDDFCGLVSAVSFNATAGNVYMLECGQYGTGPGTTWAISIGVYVPSPPPINDNCTTPTTLLGAGTYTYDNSWATTGTEGQANTNCNYFSTTAIGKDAWYAYAGTTTGNATVSTCGLLTSTTRDTKIAIYAGSGCPVANSAIACQDDVGGACTQSTLETTLSWPTTCGQLYTIQLGQYALNTGDIFGSFSVIETGTACASPSTAYCFGDGTGAACPCGNSGAAGSGCASSVNASGGNLASAGNASIANDTFVLTATGLPSSSSLYFQGTSQTTAGAGAVFGDGLRWCAWQE